MDASQVDPDDTLNFTEILLELRDSFAEFRQEAKRELAAIRLSTNFACEHLKDLGNRVTLLENARRQIESNVIALASGTPPPIDYTGGDEELPR